MSPLSISTMASSTVDRWTRNVMMETDRIRSVAACAPGSYQRNQERNVLKRIVGFRQVATFRQPGEKTGAADWGGLSELRLGDSVASNGRRTRRPPGSAARRSIADR